MSFYSITNPTSFSVVSDTRKSLVNPGKLVRSSAIANLSTFLGTTAASPITPEQLVQGVLFVNPNTTTQDFFLPRAQDLITLLMGPGGFDVSSNDIFTFRLFNINGGTNDILVKVNSLDTSPSNSGGPLTVAHGTNRAISIQINVSGSSYSYTIF